MQELRLHPILLYLSKYCPILSDSSFESKGRHGSVRLTSLESRKANVKLKQTSLTRIAVYGPGDMVCGDLSQSG